MASASLGNTWLAASRDIKTRIAASSVAWRRRQPASSDHEKTALA